MALTPEESKQLAALMQKVEFPVPVEVFNEWCANFTIGTAEIALFRVNPKTKEKEVFLTYRKDRFFDGWHFPGSVILPGKTVQDTLNKVIKTELGSITITDPKYLTWFERVKGRDEGLRGQELSLFYISYTEANIETEAEKFFSLKNIPKNLIPAHIVVVDYLKENLKN